MHKFVISGGPSTGKSTMFNLLGEVYPEAHFVPEAAELVIQREQAKHAADPSYEPIMPVTHYRKFAPLVIAEQEKNEAAIPPDAKLVILDRSFIDNLGYLAYNQVTDYVEEVHQRAKLGKYTLAFFCDWLGKVEQTVIRQENDKQGFAIHQFLETAYEESYVPIVHLPAVSIPERLETIKETIDTLIFDSAT